MATKATTGKSGLDLARKGAMQARVQALRQAAEGYIEHVRDEIAPYDELDESFDDDERRRWVSEVQQVRDDLHEQLAEVRKLAEELEDAADAQSELEDLQTDMESAMDDIDTHLAAIGAKSARRAERKGWLGDAGNWLAEMFERLLGIPRPPETEDEAADALFNYVPGLREHPDGSEMADRVRELFREGRGDGADHQRIMRDWDRVIEEAENLVGNSKSAPRGGAHKLYA